MKFRIETGIVGGVVVTPAEATIDVGATQQFEATLLDLHGEPLVGPAIEWANDDPGVATVDEDGLATGLLDGSTTIAARAGPAGGVAKLTVHGSAVAASWHPLGAGMNNSVRAFTIYNGQLIAGGEFTSEANWVASWDGGQWLGIGVGRGLNGDVYALTVHDGNLVAGGAFSFIDWASDVANNVALWAGSEWLSMGSGLNGPVHALTVFEGDIIAGGDFIGAGDQPAYFIARWDGSGWQSMGDSDGNPWVCAFKVHDGVLFAAGTAGVTRWDGTDWRLLGAPLHRVMALTTHDGYLIAGGDFGVARWDGSAWESVGGVAGPVTALTTHGTDLIVGGWFMADEEWPAGSINRCIAARSSNVVLPW